METLYTSLKDFLKQPFVTPMSLWQYTAVVGLTIVIVIFWLFVMRVIQEGDEDI